MPNQINNANKVLQWFSDMCEPNLLLPHKIIRMFELKTAIFSWAQIGLAGSFGALLVGWLGGGCSARAVSRKTPIYFIISI